MYSGSDLVSLVSALDALTIDGFLQYELNLGQSHPFLIIKVSDAKVNAFPAFNVLPQAQTLIYVYQTSDFSIPVADFITAVQNGVRASINGNAALLAAVATQMAAFSAFAATYASKG